MNIIEDFIPKGRANRPEIAMNPVYITVHDTGNRSVGADARMHAKYVKTTDDLVSWHYTVDEDFIYQHLPLSEVGWHAGDGNGDGNMKSIGIEICMNPDGNRQLAEEKAIKLIVYLMKKYNIPIQNVVMHNRWSGKNCPEMIRSRENGWDNFVARIELAYAGIPSWQLQGFNDFKKRNILNNPTYWAEKLDEKMTFGELFAILNKVIGYMEDKIKG